MAGFTMRKHRRLKKLVPVRYLRDGMTGEGIIKDLSLSGSYMTGNAPVSVGLALALQIFVPGDPEPLLIDRAIVKWVKRSEFGVDFDTLQPTVAERITTVISTLVKTQQGLLVQVRPSPLSGVLAEIGDITAVRLTCGKCGKATRVPLANRKNTSLSCSNCHEEWFPRDSSDRDGVLKLVEGLSTLSKRGKDTSSLIQFELIAPK